MYARRAGPRAWPSGRPRCSSDRSPPDARRWPPCRQIQRRAVRRARPERPRSPAAPSPAQPTPPDTGVPPTRLFVVLPGALLGRLVVVAALERDPVGLGILAARQIVGPCVTGHDRRLEHHVELSVGAHLADVDRLGDVV